MSESYGGGNGDDNFPPWLMQSRDNSGYNLDNKIMLAAIASLSAVVVLVALLNIYARYVLRRQAQRRSAIRPLGLMNAMQLQARGEPPKTGLDPSVLAVLPVFAFKRYGGQGGDESTSTAECTVCLSVLEEGELTRCLPNCKHVFHVECIDRWFGSHTTCPICRTEAEPRVPPAMGEAAIDAAPTAPPLEGTSESGLHPSSKVSGSSSRLSSFRRMLSRERSSTRMPSCGRSDDTLTWSAVPYHHHPGFNTWGLLKSQDNNTLHTLAGTSWRFHILPRSTCL